MKVVSIVNPKGGSGKSTLSTQIASYFASCGHQVMLGDADPQQSSKFWLNQRPPSLPRIASWEYQADLIFTAKAPPWVTHVVVDTPGGIDGWRLKEVVARSDYVVVPILSSAFDVLATQNFLDNLIQLTKLKKVRIGIIANRINQRTISAEKLKNFLDNLSVPVIGYLRDTQYYLHMVEHGLSMFDVSTSKVEKDLEQWQPICRWLDMG